MSYIAKWHLLHWGHGADSSSQLEANMINAVKDGVTHHAIKLLADVGGNSMGVGIGWQRMGIGMQLHGCLSHDLAQCCRPVRLREKLRLLGTF